MEKILNQIKKLIPQKLFKAIQPAYHYLLSALSAFWFWFPSEKLIVIGVTGTTGKTTSVYLIAKTLAAAGYKVGYTSTAMFSDGNKEWLNDKKMTMVGRFFTQKMLAQMVKNGCQYAIVEVTSEGVRQFRHKFINFDTLVFTGLYPEHIESHGSFENYKKEKGKLFAHLKNCKIKFINDKKFVQPNASGLKKTELHREKKTSIINLDDEHAPYFLDFWAEEKIGYKNKESHLDQKTDAKLRVINCESIGNGKNGIKFKVENKEINLQLLGAFNAMNAMNAVCVGRSQGLAMAIIKKGLEEVKGIPGRLEKIEAGQPYTVVIDYAFEPNAVSKLYEAVKATQNYGKIIHVLGSTGGGRDVARRPVLGRLAGTNADVVVVTNEDPYDDDPQSIINDVAGGAEESGKKINENLYKILDRREAIQKALSLAKENDVVLITGKGSEQAICVANGEKISWDDRAVVRGILSNK